MTIEKPIMQITFEGKSTITGNLVRGYYVKLNGKDYIITDGGDKFPVESVRLVHKDLGSLLADINQVVDNKELAHATLSLFRFTENGEDGTMGTIVASLQEAMDMLYSWGKGDESAKKTIIMTAIRLMSSDEGEDCLRCDKTQCSKHPQNVAHEMFPFIGKKSGKGPVN